MSRGRRRVDQLPLWPAVVAVTIGVGLLAAARMLALRGDDALAEVDYP